MEFDRVFGLKLSKITAIGRPIDFSYPTNRAIVALSAAAAASGFLFRLFTGYVWHQSLLWGAGAGLTLFLTWALTRELDPDNNLSAFVAAVLAWVGVFMWGLPLFLALFWLLVMVRMLNRSTGLPAKATDSTAAVFLTGALVYQGDWGFGLAAALAFFLDSRMNPPLRRQMYFAGSALILSAALLLVKEGFWSVGVPDFSAGGVALALSLVFIPAMRGVSTLKSLGDETGQPLRPARVLAGQGLALLIGMGLALLKGADGLLSMLTLWCAVIGAAACRQIKPAQKILEAIRRALWP